MSSGAEPKLRLVYFEHLESRFGIQASEMTIHRWMKLKKFPQNILIGGRKAWYEHEILEWLANLSRGKGIEPPPSRAKAKARDNHRANKAGAR